MRNGTDLRRLPQQLIRQIKTNKYYLNLEVAEKVESSDAAVVSVPQGTVYYSVIINIFTMSKFECYHVKVFYQIGSHLVLIRLPPLLEVLIQLYPKHLDYPRPKGTGS